MRASRFEYRFRFVLHALLYVFGFAAPWVSSLGWSGRTTWLVLSTSLARQGWLTFSSATIAVLVFALVCTAAGAWLRVWGTAYVSSRVVKSPAMHGESMLADGPYRHTRNPLYLGTLLHTFGIAILMPPSGAVLCVVLIWLLQIRLALAEEPFLASRFGEAYAAYRARVPRFLPMPAAQVPATGHTPHWLQAVFGELYFVAAFATLAVFGWNYNPHLIYKGLLISLGLWLIALAFVPRAKDAGLAPIERA